MRCYVRALLLCTACAFFSALYVFNQLASSLEAPGLRDQRSRTGHRTGHHDTGLRDTGLAPRRAGGEAGQHDREGPGAAARSREGPGAAARSREGPGAAARSRSRSRSRSSADQQMHLAVVACGSRLEETVTMLKSAVLFSTTPLHFHIFAEDHLHGGFRDALRSWPSVVQSRFNYTTYPITFPAQNPAEWKKLFKPCASQRLFLPLILKEVDSLLYVDTDILFLQPVEEIWSLLRLFSSTHIAAMAPEHEEPRIAWYSRFARHPYYGKTGVNSGVMLMNMSRIRGKLFKNDMTPVLLKWEELLMPLLQKYKLNITWGDQDLLNIIFHHNPESLYVFPCQWNYRPDHCIYGSNCRQAEQEGVFILHGNRGVYHDDKQPAFRAVYEAIQKFPFGENMAESLLRPLEAKLQTTTHTYCGRASHLFTKRLQRTIDTIQQGSAQARGTV